MIDFKHSQKFSFDLDRSLVGQFNKEIPISIWRKYPVKNFKPVEDEKKPPEFDIEVKQDMLGFAVVSLKPFLTDNLKQEHCLKYPVFEYQERTLRHYNIFWPHPKETEHKETFKEAIEEVRAEKYSKPVEEQPTGKTGAQKPGAKKPAPAASKKKGQAAPQAVTIPRSPYPLQERDTILYTGDVLARAGINNYSKEDFQWLVAGTANLSLKINIV